MAKKANIAKKAKQKNEKFDKLFFIIKTIVHIILIVVFTAAFAIFLAWLIQFRADGGTADFWSSFSNNSPLFWYGVLAILAVTVLVEAIIGRPFIACGILFAAALFATYANGQKLSFRNEPLLADDVVMVGQAGELLELVNIDEFTHLALAAGLAILLGVVLNHIARLIWPYNKEYNYLRRHLIAPRMVIATIAICGIGMVLQPFAEKGDRSGDEISIFGESLTFNPWEHGTNYKTSGFTIGFLYSAAKLPVNIPDNYNSETIAGIAKKYQTIADEKNKTRKDLGDVAENVVVILGESFYDPSIIEEYYPHRGGDITPNLHRIMSFYPSGYMFSPEYGGGTANVEFEVFTGLSNYWTNTMPYMNIVTKMNKVPSIASSAKESGFSTIALHSYTSGFYNRTVALKKEGFDKFVTQEQMKTKKYDSNTAYINDWSVYYETLNFLRNNNNKQMLGVITMQLHMPYDSGQYPELNFATYDEDWLVSQYFQNLHSSDEYLGYFLDVLDNFDEKTVVLYFGDHSPGIFDKITTHEDKNVRDLAKKTPYFIYANFDLGDVNLDLPTVSPNCLTNEMYDTLQSKKTAFSYLLDDVCRDVPVLAGNYYTEMAPEETETYKNYELVNYDLMSGKQYWYKFSND